MNSLAKAPIRPCQGSHRMFFTELRCGRVGNSGGFSFLQDTGMAANRRIKLLVFHEVNNNIVIYVIPLDKALPWC